MSAKRVTSTTEKPAPEGVCRSLARATVAVLMGGRSTEREVSLSSGREVLRALREPTASDDARGPEQVLRVDLGADGSWDIDGELCTTAEALERLRSIDVLFSVLHGGAGEDGTLQGFFATLGLRVAGSGVRASAVCMDKVFTRELMRVQGLRVAPAEMVTRSQWKVDGRAVLERLAALSDGVLVVKPRAGGSSVGTSLARGTEELRSALDEALAVEAEALVEVHVPGTEIAAGVVAQPGRELIALTPIEIQPHAGRFFDYEEKYSDSGAREVCPPESIDARTVKRVQELALRSHSYLGCRGFSRSDFIVPPDGSEPVFLEINTLPGFTARSLLPQSAEHDGIDFRTLCLWITTEALERSGEGC